MLLSCFTIASRLRSQCLGRLLSPTQQLLKNLLSAYCLHNAVLATGLCIFLPSCQPLSEEPMAPPTSPAFSSPTHPSRLLSVTFHSDNLTCVVTLIPSICPIICSLNFAISPASTHRFSVMKNFFLT